MGKKRAPVAAKQSTRFIAQLQQAEQMLNRGAVGQAGQLLGHILRQEPDNFHALHMLALAAYQAGDFKQAHSLMQKALGFNKKDPQLWLNFGNVLVALELYADAEAAFRKALKIKPGLPGASSGLGMVFSGRKLHQQAIECYKREIARNPDFLAAYSNLGLAYLEEEQFEAAVTTFKRVIRKQPNNIQVLKNLGAALLQDQKIDEGIESYCLALELSPNDLELNFNLAVAGIKHYRVDLAEKTLATIQALQPENARCALLSGELSFLKGENEQALAHFEKAEMFGLDKSTVQLAKARLFSKLGKFDKAAKVYSEILKSGEASAQVLSGLAKIEGGDNPEQMIRLLEDLEGQEQLADADRRQVLFSLGKLYDQQGDYGKAFECYSGGNALKREVFDRDAYREETDRLIEFFTEEVFKQNSSAIEGAERPMFVLGTPRSGTTLTEQILASHSNIYGAGEQTYFSSLSKEIARRIGGRQGYPDCLASLGQGQIDELANKYMQFMANQNSTALRYVDKMPGNFRRLGLIALLLPQARIVHCIRNPLDACLSIFFQDFKGHHPYGSDLSDIGFYYGEYQRLMEHWKQVVPNPVFELEYESLIADQEGYSKALIEFSGLEWEEDCLQFYKTERKVETASIWQVRQPIYTKSMERWRNYEPYITPLREALEGKRL